MKKEKSCGIVVFDHDKVLVVRMLDGHYGFPKGHVEENETEEETAIKSLTPAISEGEGEAYNLAGQRVSKLQKGINIVNGKKVLF